MNTCLFLSRRSGPALYADDLARLGEALRVMPGLAKALIHTPSATDDPYVKDDPSPSLVVQLYFAEISDLEAAASRSGALYALTSRPEPPLAVGAEVAQQAMVVRSFAVPEPTFQTPPDAPHCTYLVAYEGEADNLNAWHSRYLESHTAHMAQFPGIRELEVYTRLDWISALPWSRLDFMQRNKVVFDSAEALHRALNSSVRHEMRADFNTFPAFTGPNTHYAMETRVVKLC